MKIIKAKEVNIGKIIKTFSLELSEGIWIPNFKVILGPKGKFISAPSSKNYKGDYENVVYIKKDTMEKIKGMLNLTKD